MEPTSIALRELDKKFLERVEKRPNSCWIWKGAYNSSGYGLLSHKSKSIYAHRLSFELHKGPIPQGYFVCHHCDEPKCVHPDHLFIGTPGDNMQDAFNKGRPVGSRTKLSSAVIEKIKSLLTAGLPQRTIRTLTGVNQATISEINRGIRKYANELS